MVGETELIDAEESFYANEWVSLEGGWAFDNAVESMKEKHFCREL